MITGLRIKYNTIKFLEKNTRKNPCDAGFGSDFQHTTRRTIHERKIDKLDFIKISTLQKRLLKMNEKTSHRLRENICKTYIG